MMKELCSIQMENMISVRSEKGIKHMLKQKIKLMTDSVSDISKDRAEALGIHLLYMPITIEGKALREETDFTKEEFYKWDSMLSMLWRKSISVLIFLETTVHE